MNFDQALRFVTGQAPNKVQEHEEKINSILEDVMRHDENIATIQGDVNSLKTVTDDHSSRFEKLIKEQSEAEVAEDTAEEERAEADAAEETAQEEKTEAEVAEEAAEEEQSEADEAEKEVTEDKED